jgi:transcriptional regulator of heat shock response
MKNKINKEDLKNLAIDYGKELGILISSLDITPDEKMAFLSLLPKMSMEQIDRLVGILEAKYINSETQEIDKKFKEDIEKIKEKYDKQIDKVDKESIKKIKELSKKIEKYE